MFDQQDLTLEQRQVIESPAGGTLVVTGGPGSGLTLALVGRDWRGEVPDTGAGREASEQDDQARAIERRADERAYLHRLFLQVATQRLADSIPRQGAGRVR